MKLCRGNKQKAGRFHTRPYSFILFAFSEEDILPFFNLQRRILVTLVVRGMRQINIFVFSMGFIPALKIEASGGSQARKWKARRGKYARGVLDISL